MYRPTAFKTFTLAERPPARPLRPYSRQRSQPAAAGSSQQPWSSLPAVTAAASLTARRAQTTATCHLRGRGCVRPPAACRSAATTTTSLTTATPHHCYHHKKRSDSRGKKYMYIRHDILNSIPKMIINIVNKFHIEGKSECWYIKICKIFIKIYIFVKIKYIDFIQLVLLLFYNKVRITLKVSIYVLSCDFSEAFFFSWCRNTSASIFVNIFTVYTYVYLCSKKMTETAYRRTFGVFCEAEVRAKCGWVKASEWGRRRSTCVVCCVVLCVPRASSQQG